MASIGENYNNSTITALKALAIMAMVLGHAFVGTPIEKFVSLWHMPLFFFVSGFCFKEKYLVQPKEFLLKRLKGLLWPYIKFTFLFVALHNFLFELYLYDSIYSIVDIFKILRSVWIFGGGRFTPRGILVSKSPILV